MTIHTFGDSHASNTISGWKMCDNVVSHHINSTLCFSFGRDKLKRCNISKYNLQDGDIVIFCFGEIDCRCHVFKHIKKNVTYQEIIDDIVCKYIDAIKINIQNCGAKLKEICIYNVVPAVQKHNTPECKSVPYLGSDEERKSYVLYFNKRLKEECDLNNWIFFDIYDKYVDKNGFLNKKYSDGVVHIKDGIYLKEFINAHLL